MDEQTQNPLFNDMPAKIVVDQSHREAQMVFEKVVGDHDWGEIYLELLKERWPWRVAAYIAWKVIPADLREPKTQGELAAMLNISPSRLSAKVNKNPLIGQRIGAMLLSSRLLDATGGILEALIQSAKNDSYKHHADRKLALEMIGLYTPRQAVDLTAGAKNPVEDPSSLTDDQLRQLAGGGE